MKLKEGYSIIWGERSSHEGCGAGTTVEVVLMHNGNVVHEFTTCPCGCGCGNKAVVVDYWGYHDCEPEIEVVRLE